MKMENVESSAIKAMGYEDGVVEVQFHNADIYRYYDVPEVEYSRWKNADSQGIYMNSVFKSKKFRFEKVTR